MKQKIFLYGAFRKGMHKYDMYLKRENSFCGYGFIEGGLFSILEKTDVAYLPEGHDMVLGEIHEVDEKIMDIIDREHRYLGQGNINNDYHKEICSIYNQEGQIIDELPVYVWNMDHDKNIFSLGDVIKSGDYTEYLANKEIEGLLGICYEELDNDE